MQGSLGVVWGYCWPDSALSGLGWPQLVPVEQRGFENQAGVWDVGPSPGRCIPPKGQSRVGAAATMKSRHAAYPSMPHAQGSLGARPEELPFLVRSPQGTFLNGEVPISSSHT